MLWTILVILLILWLLGLVTSYTLGGFIHLLLVIALILLVIQLVTGRRTVAGEACGQPATQQQISGSLP